MNNVILFVSIVLTFAIGVHTGLSGNIVAAIMCINVLFLFYTGIVNKSYECAQDRIDDLINKNITFLLKEIELLRSMINRR